MPERARKLRLLSGDGEEPSEEGEEQPAGPRRRVKGELTGRSGGSGGGLVEDGGGGGAVVVPVCWGPAKGSGAAAVEGGVSEAGRWLVVVAAQSEMEMGEDEEKRIGLLIDSVIGPRPFTLTRRTLGLMEKSPLRPSLICTNCVGIL